MVALETVEEPMPLVTPTSAVATSILNSHRVEERLRVTVRLREGRAMGHDIPTRKKLWILSGLVGILWKKVAPRTLLDSIM